MKTTFRVIGGTEDPLDKTGSVGSKSSGELVAHWHLCDRWLRISSCVGGLFLLGCLSFFLDLAVSNALNREGWFKGIHRTLELAEPFGDFFGVILVGVGISVLHPIQRKQVPLLVLGAASSGLVADFFKLLVGRIRPTNLDWSQVRWVGDTFTNWFPLVNGGWKHQSFPSAHTATGWALALMLTRLYPRGWWFFPTIAFCVGLQRVETGSHYLSDAVMGSAIGIGVSCCWLRSSLFRGFGPSCSESVCSFSEPGSPSGDEEPDCETSVG